MNRINQADLKLENRVQKIVVVLTTRRKRIVGIHIPEANRISIGRSSRNHIRVDDPYFPRLAGEVILKPAPLIRIPASGSDENRVQRISAHKPIHLSPYYLHLIEEGDVMRNRKWHKKTKHSSKKAPGWKIFAVIASAVVLIWGVSSKSVLNDPDDEKRSKEYSMPFDVSRLLEEASRKEKQVVKVVATALHTKSARQKSTPPRTQLPKTVRRKVDNEGLSEESFTKILELASFYLAKGDGRGAKRCISPIQTLLSQKQLEQLIGKLEPFAEKIFRKAYILRSFDSNESDRIFRELSMSGLEMLPSVGKAKKINLKPNH